MISAEPVYRDDWIFKVSENEDVILVHSYNKVFHWSNVRFFYSEIQARNFIDYIVLQTALPEGLQSESKNS